MSKIKALAFGCFGALVSLAAQASTLDDLVAAQRAALLAEALKKAEAAKPAPVAPVAPVVVQTVGRNEPKREVKDTSLDEAKLVAVYGPIARLTADIAYQGAVFPVRAGGDAIEGWVADSISQSRVVLRKIDAHGKTLRTQNIYLSDATVTAAVTVTRSNVGGFGGMGPSPMGGMPSMQMPPMPMQMPMTMPASMPAPNPVPVASPPSSR